jgi:hypothetical protein
MSDAPDRSIKGLAPRGATPDFSRLQRRNRISPVTSAPQPPAKKAPVEAQLPDPVRPAAAAPLLVSGERERVTTYLDGRLRARAREAYRATSHLEGDKSWSDFVERAILSEVLRREATHNRGQTYARDQFPLSPGRSLK